MDSALARIRTTTALEDFADRDFVTEAVFESEEVKAEVYRALDRICLPRSILASNTSTIPISTLASYVGEARRPYFIGTHYFSPASRDRKSTRLNSSHSSISYAVFCLKKK